MVYCFVAQSSPHCLLTVHNKISVGGRTRLKNLFCSFLFLLFGQRLELFAGLWWNLALNTLCVGQQNWETLPRNSFGISNLCISHHSRSQLSTANCIVLLLWINMYVCVCVCVCPLSLRLWRSGQNPQRICVHTHPRAQRLSQLLGWDKIFLGFTQIWASQRNQN